MLKRQPGTLFLVACLILTTLPTALGAPSAPVVYVSEEHTAVTDEGIINDTILMDSTEQEIEAENAAVGNDQINSDEIYLYDAAVTETVPEEGFENENDQINSDEIYLDDTAVTETMPEEGFESENAASSVVDNRLREASPNTVYKEKSYLDIGDRPGIGKYRELLLFDLSEYSDAENISSATLSLYWFYPDGKERPRDTIIEVYRPAAAWNPENVTWNNRDIDVLWIQPGGDWFDRNRVSQGDDPYATITLKAGDLPDNRYYELDVTDLVKEYVSSRYENTGFLIKTRTESADYVAFYSSDTEKEEQRPKLNIEET
ncbi:disaggregatase related repeat-containing protein [Methanosarcina sp.]|uniref:disaggregatase related repeat-containing protein n=1 Tax=Methanosarcina sp. TaxID=2213 RepID=UPI003C757ADE